MVSRSLWVIRHIRESHHRLPKNEFKLEQERGGALGEEGDGSGDERREGPSLTILSGRSWRECWRVGKRVRGRTAPWNPYQLAGIRGRRRRRAPATLWEIQAQRQGGRSKYPHLASSVLVEQADSSSRTILNEILIPTPPLKLRLAQPSPLVRRSQLITLLRCSLVRPLASLHSELNELRKDL